jgi:uncharacterized protein (DUF2384 family)
MDFIMKGIRTVTNSRKRALSVVECERRVGVAKLIGQVDSIVSESGSPEGFKAATWFSEWIEQPATALGGYKPKDLLDTADGRETVSKLLSQMQSGAYA